MIRRMMLGMMIAALIGMFTSNEVEAANASVESVTEHTVSVVGLQICIVEIEKASSFYIKIPRNIIMSGAEGAENKYTYTIVVGGDIPGYATITAVPDASFDFSQTGKADVRATVEQTLKAFSYGMMTGGSVSTTGVISASGLTAGKWSGAFQFRIAYTEVE